MFFFTICDNWNVSLVYFCLSVVIEQRVFTKSRVTCTIIFPIMAFFHLLQWFHRLCNCFLDFSVFAGIYVAFITLAFSCWCCVLDQAGFCQVFEHTWMLCSIQLVNSWSRDGNHEFMTCEWCAHISEIVNFAIVTSPSQYYAIKLYNWHFYELVR